jgi:hypothetical protein
MTLTLELPTDLQNALFEDALNQGKPPEQVVLDALRRDYPLENSGMMPQTQDKQTGSERSVRPGFTRRARPFDQTAFLAALSSFEAGDAAEQHETLQTLMTNLDRNRPGQRRIFGEGVNPMSLSDDVN